MTANNITTMLMHLPALDFEATPAGRPPELEQSLV